MRGETAHIVTECLELDCVDNVADGFGVPDDLTDFDNIIPPGLQRLRKDLSSRVPPRYSGKHLERLSSFCGYTSPSEDGLMPVWEGYEEHEKDVDAPYEMKCDIPDGVLDLSKVRAPEHDLDVEQLLETEQEQGETDPLADWSDNDSDNDTTASDLESFLCDEPGVLIDDRFTYSYPYGLYGSETSENEEEFKARVDGIEALIIENCV